MSAAISIAFGMAESLEDPPIHRVTWAKTHRIIRSRFPLIGLFEDIADPADWEAILSAESKTNPGIATSVGMLDLLPPDRRVSGDGTSWAMAPFVHVSPGRPSRLSDGCYGVYYAGDCSEVALFETIHHHNRFMVATAEAPGWTSDFRALVGSLDADLHDVTDKSAFEELYHPDDYASPQTLARELRDRNANGLLYHSVRYPVGQAVALFWPDVAGAPKQGDHFSCFWDGSAVSRVRNMTSGDILHLVA